ncbi:MULTISPECIES: oligosaccharide flippase family protein [Thermodesulfovibrio]|uniref:oligosaccharide flippase family protein n=1 Tax=Thermodesulfovibrio TaxID=28261 RepID=UPI0026266DA8|nr:oligosaccharide flippase family protein [Thermodesulfovibrio sp.]
MIKEFFKNSLLYFLSNILIKGLQVLLLPIYTRFLSPYDYGVLDLFNVVFTFINIIFTVEITQAIARYYQESKNLKQNKEYISTAFLFTLFIYSIYLLKCIVFAESLAEFLIGGKTSKKIFILGSVSIFFNGLFYFTINLLKWRVEPGKHLIISIINSTLTITISIPLLIHYNLKIEAIFLAQIITNFLTTILAIYYSRDDYAIIFKYKKFQKLVRFSFPLMLSSMAMIGFIYEDRIFINYMLGINDLGLYGVAYRFSTIAGLFMYGFQNSLMPLIYRDYSDIETPNKIAHIFLFFIFLVISVTSFTIIFSRDLIVLLTTESYYGSYTAIPFLTMATFFLNSYIFTPGMWIRGKTKIFFIITITAFLINSILNYIFIKLTGFNGAAMATLVSSIIFFSLNILISQRYYPIPYKLEKIIFILLFAIMSFVISLFISANNQSIITKISLYLLINFAYLFFLIDKQKIFPFIRNLVELKKKK